MNKFRIWGTLICVVSIVLAVLFIWGLVAGEPYRFWAVAAPVILLTSIALGLAFSVGRLMASTKMEDKQEDQPGE